MPITRFPNGLSSFGVPVMGNGGVIPTTTGTYYFVDSSTGSDGNDGLDPDHPLATIDYAVGLCTANKGDVIICMPNHSETMTTAGHINLDKEGIYLVGLGSGNNRPVINVSTSTGADMDIGSDSITIRNFYFDATGVDACVGMIDVNDNHCTIEDCEFLCTDSGGQAEDVILGDANADTLRILNCKFVATTACGQSCIHIAGASAGLEVANCWFDGDWNKGVVYTTAAVTNVLIHNNYIRQDGAEGPFDLGATSVASEGLIACNYCDLADSDASDKLATATGQVKKVENYVALDYSCGGFLSPVVEAT